MSYYITPREDDSRHYDVIEYSESIPFITLAILRGDSYGDTIYVDRKEFGLLMRKRDYANIHLQSRRSQKYVKKYRATVDKDHPLYEDWMAITPGYCESR
jgi:hypothetical protein